MTAFSRPRFAHSFGSSDGLPPPAEDELHGEARGDELRDGRRFGVPPKPYEPPAKPEGTINVVDPDS